MTAEPEEIEADAAYADMAAGLLDAVEAGGGSWVMPWHAIAGLPSAPHTGRPFRGSNVLALWAARRRHKLASQLWAKETTWTKLGGTITRRDRAVWLHVPRLSQTGMSRWRPQDGASRPPRGIGPVGGDPAGVLVQQLLGFTRERFFCRDDVEGARLPAAGLPQPFAPLEAAERVTRAYVANRGPAVLHGGARAYYDPGVDRVQMPPRESFVAIADLSSNASYYATLLHELVHSTASRGRLNRNLKSSFGSVAYAREELVAEIGSAFLGARIGLPMALRESHARYVRSWLTVLSSDRRAFFTAVTAAEKAADHVLAKAAIPELGPV